MSVFCNTTIQKTEENIKSVFYVTERVGFEPTEAFTSPVFKTGAFNHSTTFPKI